MGNENVNSDIIDFMIRQELNTIIEGLKLKLMFLKVKESIKQDQDW